MDIKSSINTAAGPGKSTKPDNVFYLDLFSAVLRDKEVLEAETLTALHGLSPLLILKQCSLSDHTHLSE